MLAAVSVKAVAFILVAVVKVVALVATEVSEVVVAEEAIMLADGSGSTISSLIGCSASICYSDASVVLKEQLHL